MLALYATLALSHVVLHVDSAPPSASVTCADEPASCDGAWVFSTAAQATRAKVDDFDGPQDYSTPVEVECPVTEMIGQMFSDSCEQEAPDLWYRVSRVPDGGPAGTVAAARRPHGASTTSSFSCSAPQRNPGHVSPPDAQPLALTAVPGLFPDGTHSDLPRDAQAPPARSPSPPDRPPRV